MNSTILDITDLKQSIDYKNDDENDETEEGSTKMPEEEKLLGEPPYFTKKDDLLKILARPSGNMIRLKCPAKGSILE